MISRGWILLRSLNHIVKRIVSERARRQSNVQKSIRRLFEKPDWDGVETTEYDMPHVVLECTGIESSICTAAFTARRGGIVNVVGVSSKTTIDNVPFMHMSLAEIKLLFIQSVS